MWLDPLARRRNPVFNARRFRNLLPSLGVPARKVVVVATLMIAASSLVGFAQTVSNTPVGGAPADPDPENNPKNKRDAIDPAYIESMRCEIEAATDGTLEEFNNREAVALIVEDLRARGLMDEGVVKGTVDFAMNASQCAPVAMGQSVCETLENHRYANVDPKCREMLLFEDARYNPIILRAPDAEHRQVVGYIALIEVQMAEVYPTLTETPGPEIPPELGVSPIIVTAIKWLGGAIIAGAAYDYIKSLPGRIEDVAWTRRADGVVKLNSGDMATMESDRVSIRDLENAREKEVEAFRSANETMDIAIENQFLPKEDIEAFRAEKTVEHESAIKKIDEEIGKREANITKSARDMADRSEQILKERKPEIEDFCEKETCPEFLFDIQRTERYERELGFCEALYQNDSTIVSVGRFKVSPDLEGVSRASTPKCNIEVFERITSAVTERIVTLEDIFGQQEATDVAKGDAWGSLDPEAALQIAIRNHESVCKLTPGSCDCKEAEGRLDRAMERRYSREDLPGDIVAAYGVRKGSLLPEVSTEPVVASSDWEVPAFGLCERKPVWVFEEGEEGEVVKWFARMISPGDADYPTWSRASGICDLYGVPFKSDWELGKSVLAPRPAPEVSQAQMKTLFDEAEAAYPAGSRLITEYRRQFAASVGDCDQPPSQNDLLPSFPGFSTFPFEGGSSRFGSQAKGALLPR